MLIAGNVLVPFLNLDKGAVISVATLGQVIRVEETTDGVTTLCSFSAHEADRLYIEQELTRSAPCGSSSPPKSSASMFSIVWSRNAMTSR